MPLVNEYKKCLKCGDIYRIESQLTKCMCGGHLYTVGAIYQPKIRKGSSCAGATEPIAATCSQIVD